MMEILCAEYVEDKLAELMLTDDHIVIVKYDGIVISESGDETWLNIQDIYELYLRFCVNVHLRECRRRQEHSRLLEEAGSLGWNDIS